MSKNDRDFKFGDAELIEHASVVASTLPEDIGDFTAFDSTITTDYPATVQTGIDAALSVKQDQVIIDEMAALTDSLNEAMGECSQAYRTIMFFVKKAYPGNEAMRNQFGYNDVAKIRNRQSKMILFMNDLAKTAVKYQSDLVAAGCNEAVITSLSDKATALYEANEAQERFKKERGLLTQERVEKYNDLYALLSPLSMIAQIIYADDPARMNRYLLPKPKGSIDNPDDLVTS